MQTAIIIQFTVKSMPATIKMNTFKHKRQHHVAAIKTAQRHSRKHTDTLVYCCGIGSLGGWNTEVLQTVNARRLD